MCMCCSLGNFFNQNMEVRRIFMTELRKFCTMGKWAQLGYGQVILGITGSIVFST